MGQKVVERVVASAGTRPRLVRLREASLGRQRRALEGWLGRRSWRRLCKRAFDTALTSLGLAILWPLLLLIAILIRLDSAGPVLFRQERVGEDGRPFAMFKFRSMCVGADPSIHQAHVTSLIVQNLAPAEPGGGNGNGSLKLAHDPRVTRVGRFIRRASIDELPQLFNVLRGEMSLVGPRPHLPYEVALYQPRHWRRLGALPGITGLWQVEGRNRVSFEEMVSMDLEYIERQSLWLDIQLLLRTPWAVVKGDGAG